MPAAKEIVLPLKGVLAGSRGWVDPHPAHGVERAAGTRVFPTAARSRQRKHFHCRTLRRRPLNNKKAQNISAGRKPTRALHDPAPRCICGRLRVKSAAGRKL
jgi:hypothetical protein